MLRLVFQALPLLWRVGLLAAALAVFVGGITAAYFSWRNAIYQEGVMAERIEWSLRVVESGKKRTNERRQAEADQEARARELVQAEDRMEALRKERDQALHDALLKEHDPIVIPDVFLQPLRELAR